MLDPPEALLQRLARRAEGLRWYDLQVQTGPNVMGEKIDSALRSVSLRSDDLPALLATWQSGARALADLCQSSMHRGNPYTMVMD